MSRVASPALGSTVLLAATAALAGPVSPSKVLEKADASVGAQLIQLPWRGGPEGEDDKTLAPYFYVAGGDSDTERLPLKETSADVSIAGVIAKVKVRQVFENGGSKPIEAVYVFPASTRAAVHGMRMKIGGRTVEARIDKKADARQQYEAARQQGKRASLLEQQRANVFTMNVANIMPRDRIEVELDYSELLVPEDSVYEFVYPAVVGPRYGGGADPNKDKWIANPYLQEGQQETYKFDIKVHLETGIALKDVASPSHAVDVSYGSKSSANVTLKQHGGGNKDYVLRYRLAGDQVESGVLLWQGERENFFLVMVEPPQRPTAAQLPPREYIFLLDVSGSMHGFPLETSKELMRNLLPQLKATDQFNIVTFSGAASIWHPEGSVVARPENIQAGIDAVNRLTGGGGTELMGGLRMAYGIPKKDSNVSRNVVVVTDGYVSVEAQSFKFIREHLGEANCFAFGIGSAVNRGIIEGMARAGMGESFVVLRPDKAREEAARLQAYIQHPVLTNIQVKFPGFDTREVAPLRVPDLLARRPVVVFGKYQGAPGGKVEVTGFTGGGRFQQALPVSELSVKAENHPIKWLWARKWVSILDDEMALAPAQEIEDAITDLGLSYSLLTSYTSFVAVDSEVANQGGQQQTVEQPLPLPEGVSNLVVGVAMPMSLKPQMRSMAAPASAGDYAADKRKAVREEAADALSSPAPGRGGAGLNAAGVGDEKDAKAAAQVSVKVELVRATGVSDEKALLRALTRLAEQAVAECGAGTAALTLRVTLDAGGKVTGVEIVKVGDKALTPCLVRKLSGWASGARLKGPAPATVEFTVTTRG